MMRVESGSDRGPIRCGMRLYTFLYDAPNAQPEFSAHDARTYPVGPHRLGRTARHDDSANRFDSFRSGRRTKTGNVLGATVYMTVAGARRFQGIRPQSVYIKDQPSWPISVSSCIYETYDLGETLILGGGFRTGPPAVSNGCTTVFKAVALCTTRLSIT